MRRAISAERGTKLNTLSEHFKHNEEIVVVGEGRPMGIVTPKDTLELVLPTKTDSPVIHMNEFLATFNAFDNWVVMNVPRVIN